MVLPGYHEALIRRGKTLQVSHVPTELPGAGGLLVALSYVGVCGTDLQILNGSRPDTAEILGHEGVGVVVKTGGAETIPVGEHVVFNPAAQLYDGRILGHNTPGLFQKYITVVPRALEDGLVMSAKDCPSPLCGTLVEPLACVIYAHELVSNRVPDLHTAVVFGAGPVGLLATIWLRSLGVSTFLIHPDPERLKTAIRLEIANAAAMLTVSDNVAEQILARNSGHPVDAVFICTTRAGAPSALTQAIQIVKHGGCIDLITNYPETEVPRDVSAYALRTIRAANVCGIPREGAYLDTAISGRRIAFASHRGTSHAHLQKSVYALSHDVSAYTRIITHVMSLPEAAGAIQALSQSRNHTILGRDCIKLALDMTGSHSDSRPS